MSTRKRTSPVWEFFELTEKAINENKSDISYLKTSRTFDVLIHSGKPNSVG